MTAVWSAMRRAYARCAWTASHSSRLSAADEAVDDEDEKRDWTGDDEAEEDEASDEGEVERWKWVIMGGTNEAPPMWTTWWLSLGWYIVRLGSASV